MSYAWTAKVTFSSAILMQCFCSSSASSENLMSDASGVMLPDSIPRLISSISCSQRCSFCCRTPACKVTPIINNDQLLNRKFLQFERNHSFGQRRFKDSRKVILSSGQKRVGKISSKLFRCQLVANILISTFGEFV